MGTISEKLTYLNETKQLLKDNINNLGGNLTNEPFRQYSSVLEGIYAKLPKINGNGSIIKLNPTLSGKMLLNGVYGDTEQDGTPTPDTPVEIQSVTGLQNINVCGKNLFDKSTIIEGKYIDGNGVIQNDPNNFLGDFIEINNTKNYYISADTSSAKRIGYYNSNKEYISREVLGVRSSILTIPNNTKYVRLSCYNDNLDTLQLEQNSTATTYEPYKGNTYEVNLGDIELCKIGDYQDRIYKDDDTWYLEKQIGKVVLDGTQIYNANLSDPSIGRYDFLIDNAKLQGLCLSTHFKYAFVIANGNIFISGSAENDVSIINAAITTKESMLTWLENNKPIIYYQLATPTTTEITNTELINQLEELSNTKSYDGQTNISITSEDLPCILDISALKGE